MANELANIRSHFPVFQQENPPVFFDGPGGTQMCEQAINAMVNYIKSGMANLHGAFNSSIQTDNLLLNARAATADLLDCEADEVAFGQNMTSLAFAIARALSTTIKAGDEIVLSELDHHANIDPWLSLANDCGAVIKWIPVNVETCSLDLRDLEQIITPKTKLLAVGYSSNVCGTINPVEQIIARAKSVGAITIIDAVHATPHLPVSFNSLDCDVLLCSAYKFFGPHLGIALIRQELFEQLAVYKLAPAPSFYPDKLETGTQNHEALAALIGTIDYIAGLGNGLSRKLQLRNAMENLKIYEEALGTVLENVLSKHPTIQLYRAPIEQNKTPTFAFTLKGISPRAFCEYFAQHRINIADGHFYAYTFAQKAALIEHGSWIRIGLAPYNTFAEYFEDKLNEFMASQVS